MYVNLLQDSQRLLPNYEPREDVLRSSPLNMVPRQNGEPWKSTSGLYDNNRFVTIDSAVIKPALIDIQGSLISLFHYLGCYTN